MPVMLSETKRVLDSLPSGALLVDGAGIVVYANPRATALQGEGALDLVGRRLSEMFPGTEGTVHERQRLTGDVEPRQVESSVLRADGSRLPVMVNAAPLADDYDADRPQDYWLVLITDITLVKAAEADVRSQYRYIAQISNTVIDQAMELKDYNQRLEEKVRERTRELHEAHLDAIYMLAVASEAKDLDTGRHVRRIQHYAEALALKLGLPAPEAEAIGYAAILHDVGKFHVRDAILKKPGPLTAAEREEMKLHTISGERILSANPFFDRARRIARGHHENWDGSGYPDGAAGDAIPLEARIVHVADVYDALVNERVYKKPWHPHRALAELKAGSGRVFDRDAVEAFVSCLGEETTAAGRE